MVFDSDTYITTGAVLTTVFLVLFYILPPTIQWFWQYYNVARVSRAEFPGLELPPGTMGYPLIGETLQFLRKKCLFYEEKVEKYGLIYKTHLLGRPTIRVIGAENVKKILLGENTLVTHNWPTSTRLLLGSGSITQSTGQIHKIRRRHMMQAFRMDDLEKMIPAIQEVVRSSLNDWKTMKNIYTYPQCKLMAFTIAACTLVGLDLKASRNSGMHETFTDFLNNLFTIPLDVPGFGFRKGMNAKRQLIKILDKLLPLFDERPDTPYTPVLKAYFEASTKHGVDSTEEISESAIDLLFAGHETVTSAATNCVMFLGKHKHVVERLREELRDNGLLEQEGYSSTQLGLQTINGLKYLNCVMKEVLRLCPPAGGGFRKALQSFELGGYLIPKDWTIIFSIRETQHLSPLFKHSEQFNPDRWSDEKITSDSERFHYLPFGFGTRACIGKTFSQLVIKVFLIELVRTCDWRLKNENIEMRYMPVPVATDHLPATFTDPVFAG